RGHWAAVQSPVGRLHDRPCLRTHLRGRGPCRRAAGRRRTCHPRCFGLQSSGPASEPWSGARTFAAQTGAGLAP
nr:hypothetical protein [Tanacetum cinerariifolium]